MFTAGAGKSVLTYVILLFVWLDSLFPLSNSSAIIRDINGVSNAGSAHVIIFFFDFQDTAKQDARGLVSSLIIQLSDKSPSFYRVLSYFYSMHQKGSSQPSIDALTKCFEDLLMAGQDIPTDISLDALDECPNTNGIRPSRDEVLVVVEKLVKLNLEKLHIYVTSRPEADIRTSLELLTSASNRILVHEQTGQKKDIADFIRAFVGSDKNMQRWRDEDKELVIETPSEKEDGM
jgi:ankyrin repeat domain-containing protein 50